MHLGGNNKTYGKEQITQLRLLDKLRKLDCKTLRAQK